MNMPRLQHDDVGDAFARLVLLRPQDDVCGARGADPQERNFSWPTARELDLNRAQDIGPLQHLDRPAQQAAVVVPAIGLERKLEADISLAGDNQGTAANVGFHGQTRSKRSLCSLLTPRAPTFTWNDQLSS
jgi:hypothetical protein